LGRSARRIVDRRAERSVALPKKNLHTAALGFIAYHGNIHVAVVVEISSGHDVGGIKNRCGTTGFQLRESSADQAKK